MWRMVADHAGDDEKGAPAGEICEDFRLCGGVDGADGVDDDGGAAAAIEQAIRCFAHAVIGCDSIDHEKRVIGVIAIEDLVRVGAAEDVVFVLFQNKVRRGRVVGALSKGKTTESACVVAGMRFCLACRRCSGGEMLKLGVGGGMRHAVARIGMPRRAAVWVRRARLGTISVARGTKRAPPGSMKSRWVSTSTKTRGAASMVVPGRSGVVVS